MEYGSVYRRCGCRDESTGRLLGARCPGLRDVKHGSWYFSAELPSGAGQRRRVTRGGFAAQAAAVAALEALASPAVGPEPGLSTGEWLGRWLASRLSLRASTARSYAAHIRGYLVPYLGGIPLAVLTPGDMQATFTAVIRDETALGRPVSAATVHRIHSTLRAALNGAVRAGLIAVNPGRFPELPRAVRPRAQVWTPALAERWQNEGWRPQVGVWTAAQTAEFLHRVRGHRLYALFHLVALRALRQAQAEYAWANGIPPSRYVFPGPGGPRSCRAHARRSRAAGARRGDPRPARKGMTSMNWHIAIEEAIAVPGLAGRRPPVPLPGTPRRSSSIT
jgi:hypothetical protein